jgi:hypothetical protein
MRASSGDRLREVAGDIEGELRRLQRLADDIEFVQSEATRDSQRARLFYENLALKLHNFYNGCERIFQIVATELNSGLPEGDDWHRRLLERMSMERQGRVEVVSEDTARALETFRAFRHVVRNIYGFEIVVERVEQLVDDYRQLWPQVRADVERFVQWLRALAATLDT